MPLALLCALLVTQTPAPEFTFKEGLGVSVPGNPRTALRVDAVEYRQIHEPKFVPELGETVGSSKWEKVEANAEGNFSGGPFRSGYSFFTYESADDESRVLEAVGHSMVYVNGEPRAGDPYGYGYMGVPVRIRKGTNTFLFASGRGSLRAKLVKPQFPIEIDLRDPTLPDIIEGHKGEGLAGIVIRNNSSEVIRGREITAQSDTGKEVVTKLPNLQPYSIRKVKVNVPLEGTGKTTFRLRSGGDFKGSIVQLRVRKPNETFRVTFESKIDGSVQYYAVNPPSKPAPGMGLVLSLHGASVEAQGQAEAYGQKDWCYIVCPTNRRPFGFDWEEWGRLDAIEVLEDAQAKFHTDKSKTYLTGHSMGGHGAWQLASHYPDRFAAVGPSAGWISFWTYAGGASYPNPNPVQAMMLRSASGSDTLALKNNLAQMAVYVLHGDADDNVPVAQARTMMKELSPFHKDLHSYEEKGAGHWWDNSPEPGAACVDWKPMFEIFKNRRIPKAVDVKTIDFASASPSINGKCHWVEILQQIEPWKTSKINISVDSKGSAYKAETTNVSALRISYPKLSTKASVSVTIDSQTLSGQADLHAEVLLVKKDQKWEIVAELPNGVRQGLTTGSARTGMNRNFVFIIGMTGNLEQRQWSYAKARYDAEMFYYRGNGSVDIMTDKEWVANPTKGRSLVVYGNEQINTGFGFGLSKRPFFVGEDGYSHRNTKGGNLTGSLAGIFHYRGQEEGISNLIFAGTDMVGCRLLNRVPFFVSGAGFPDLFVFRPSLLKGNLKDGVVEAGYFGNDWSIENGNFVLGDPQ